MAMPAGRGDRVLFGDADVEAPVGEAIGEGKQSGGVGHGGRDGHHLGPFVGLLDEASVNAWV